VLISNLPQARRNPLVVEFVGRHALRQRFSELNEKPNRFSALSVVEPSHHPYDGLFRFAGGVGHLGHQRLAGLGADGALVLGQSRAQSHDLPGKGEAVPGIQPCGGFARINSRTSSNRGAICTMQPC
jgi:hypothetical protein